jgi:esterase/lipase superfamily enzyme
VSELLIFLHGYKTSFEDAIKSTAQLACDLNFSGQIACFSWPSYGDFKAYGGDGIHIGRCSYIGTEFLIGMLSRTGAARVHVIAHSMGNRLLANSLAGMVGRLNGTRFDQFILAAPDIEVDDFCSNAAHYYPQLAKRTTLYTSNKDVALRLAGMAGWPFIHDAPRVGYHGTPEGLFGPNWPITVVPNIDTVEISQVNPSWHGHSYHSDAERVQDDMARLLLDGADPKLRGLVGALEQNPNPRCRIPHGNHGHNWILPRLAP